METMTVDDLKFEVRRSSRRRTVEITVDRDGELIISSPPNVDETALAAFVREKRFWIHTKLAEKELLRQPVAGKEFVSGEGFTYLGRSYRLVLVDEQEVRLKLESGRFKLKRDCAPDGRRCFVQWYTDHAQPWLEKRTSSWAARMNVAVTRIEVRDLGFRWGSCSKDGTVNFHWSTILLPPSVIDYVIVHELAHTFEPNHTPMFWSKVAQALPEFEQRKKWLAERGGELRATTEGKTA